MREIHLSQLGGCLDPFPRDEEGFSVRHQGGGLLCHLLVGPLCTPSPPSCPRILLGGGGAGSVAVLPCPSKSEAPLPLSQPRVKTSFPLLSEIDACIYVRPLSCPAPRQNAPRAPASPAHLHMQGLCLEEGGEGGGNQCSSPSLGNQQQLSSSPSPFISPFLPSRKSFFLSFFLPPSLPPSIPSYLPFFLSRLRTTALPSDCRPPNPVYYTRERFLSLPTVPVIYCCMTNHFQNSHIKHTFSFGLGLPDKVLQIFYL